MGVIPNRFRERDFTWSVGEVHSEVVGLNAKIAFTWLACRIGRYFRKQARTRITRHHIGADRQPTKLVNIPIGKRLPLPANGFAVGGGRLPAHIVGNSSGRKEITLVGGIDKDLCLDRLSGIHRGRNNSRTLLLHRYQTASKKHFHPHFLEHGKIKFFRRRWRKVPDSTDLVIKLLRQTTNGFFRSHIG